MEWDVPSGWSHWGGFKGSGNTYNSFNATMYTVDFDQANTDLPPACWQNGWQGDCPHEQMTGIHQAVRPSHLCSLACKLRRKLKPSPALCAGLSWRQSDRPGPHGAGARPAVLRSRDPSPAALDHMLYVQSSRSVVYL